MSSAGQQFPEVDVIRASLPVLAFRVGLFDAAFGVGAARGVHLTYGQCLNVSEVEEGAEVEIIGHLATADEAHGDAFAGRRLAVGAQHRARYDRGKHQGGRGGVAQEASARQMGDPFHGEPFYGVSMENARRIVRALHEPEAEACQDPIRSR